MVILSSHCFFNKLVMEDSHVFIDGISEKFIKPPFIKGSFFRISRSIEFGRAIGGEVMFSDVFSIIFTFLGFFWFFFFMRLFFMAFQVFFS